CSNVARLLAARPLPPPRSPLLSLLLFSLFFLPVPPPPSPPLFPYTTLFRSLGIRRIERQNVDRPRQQVDDPSCVALGARALCRRSEEHTSELQSLTNLVCRLLLEKKKNNTQTPTRFDSST